MIINHNMMALNAIRNANINQSLAAKSMQKLSSGLRINGAADDAAGLAISEKMKGQINGLNQASSNAQDGISLAQTAEGALNETTSILQRMRELAVQSSNGTNTNDDRTAIQSEVSQLKSEIDRIGNTTQFNTKTLLDGSLQSSGVSVGANTTNGAAVGKLIAGNLTGAGSFAAGSGVAAASFVSEKIVVDGTQVTVNWQNLSTTDQTTITTGTTTGATATAQNQALSLILSNINSAIDASGANVAHVTGYVSTSGSLVIQSGSAGTGSSISVVAGAGVLNVVDGAGTGASSNVGQDNYNGTTIAAAASFNFSINGTNLQGSFAGATNGTDMASVAVSLQTAINNAITTANNAAGAHSIADPGWIQAVKVNVSTDGRLEISSQTAPISFTDLAGMNTVQNLGLSNAQTSAAGNGGMTFQIGANSNQTLTFGISDMRTAALGLSGVDVSTVAGAENAITSIDSATKLVSAQRANLGAIENRLSHTINNLGTASENLTSSQSQIADVDMATEMANYSKENVLSQAAQAMLAQANQQPQQVLQLLR